MYKEDHNDSTISIPAPASEMEDAVEIVFNKTFLRLSGVDEEGLIRSICSEEDEEAIGQARELAEQTCNQEIPK